MYSRGLLIKGLLIVSMAGFVCGYALAADQPRQPTQPGTGTMDQPTLPQRPGTTTPGLSQRPGAMGQMMSLSKSSELIGKKVKNTQGEDLGTIKDLVLTADHQQVSYAALSYGGVLGIGDKLFAVPWNAINVSADKTVTLSVDKQTLDQSSGFNKDNWPAQGNSRLFSAGAAGRSSFDRTSRTSPGQMSGSTSDRTGSTSSDRMSGSTSGQTGNSTSGQAGGTASDQSTRQRDITSTDRSQIRDRDRSTARDTMGYGSDEMEGYSTAGSADIKYRRVSHLTGMSVTNPQGEDIGDIEDFVIDNQQGQIAYTIISFGGFWGIGEKYAAVPAAALDLQPRRNVARIDADRQTLESIAFETSNFPDLSNREYAQRVYTTFRQEPYWTAFGYVGPDEQRAADQKAWGADSEYNRNFNADQVTTIRGTVQSVGTFVPARGASEGLRLRIKTDDGKEMTVHAGPVSYADQQNFYVSPGDQVTITGSQAKIGWRQVVLASEIQKGNQTLRLRSKTGEPQWQTSMSQMRPGMSRTPTEVSPGQSTRQPGQTGMLPGQSGTQQTDQQRNQSRQQQSGTGTY